MIKMIWAQDLAGGIGKDGGLPWKCKADMKHFAKLTKGATVVMGRKTWDSLPFKQGLPGRRNLVMTRDKTFDEAEVCTFDQVLHLEQDVWIIGGGEVYELFTPYAEEFHVSQILGEFICDTFAPVFPHKSGVVIYLFEPDK